MFKNTCLVASLAATCLAAEAASAQCPSLDFEELPITTPVTNNYTGVTFSTQELPGSCGVSFPEIQTPAGPTWSGTQALGVDNGSIGSPACEFHPQWMRVVFASPVHHVEFRLGPGELIAQDYEVRAYTTTSGTGGEILPRQVFTTSGGVLYPVTVTSGSDIVRIEVQAFAGGFSAGFECIDDFQVIDSTPPTAEIDAPTYESCACGIISMVGTACDDDGEYSHDKAEYRPVDAPPGEPWTLIGSFASPLCSPGTLYTWDTSALPHGKYYLRLTVTNQCGLEASDTTVVFVDKQFDTIDVRYPNDGDIIGGSSCTEGTVWDEGCFAQYTVDYQPDGGGSWTPVDGGNAAYFSRVTNDPFATFNTTALPDGDYTLRVTGTDICGNSSTVFRAVTLDNTPPVSVITSPVNCGYVDGPIAIIGTADDANLNNWSLAYLGGGEQSWTTIASSSTPVVDDVLANWDPTINQLVPCSYTLRLRVTDQAKRGCTAPSSHVSDYYLSLSVGACCDINRDGSADGLDVQPFVNCLLNGTSCP